MRSALVPVDKPGLKPVRTNTSGRTSARAARTAPSAPTSRTIEPEADRSVDPASMSMNADAVRVAQLLVKVLVRGYHRAEARNVENVPAAGGALIVSNHSGGLLSMDVPVIATAIWKLHGVERNFRVLAHDMLMAGPVGRVLSEVGFVSADRKAAQAALRAGAVTVVFPGGEWDVYRPTKLANKIDFGGRVGYVRAALKADVPIVPVVSIGGHENQLILTRGEGLARRIPFMSLLRSKVAPVVVGFPFGVTVAVPQLPLPSKIVTEFLAPVHIREEFGPDPDPNEVDEVIRGRMQAALDELARNRRFPVLG